MHIVHYTIRTMFTLYINVHFMLSTNTFSVSHYSAFYPMLFFKQLSPRDEPPVEWLYSDVTPEGLTILTWVRVLAEARAQIVTLHEGGSGIWAGCLARPGVLLHSLVQERAESEHLPISEVRIYFSNLHFEIGKLNL